MSEYWMLKTNGDPLGTLSTFLMTIWHLMDLDRMLVPLNGKEDNVTRPQLIEVPSRLSEVNPFKPLMTLNAAKLIPDLIDSHPEEKLGALLRPCEMRALVEMIKRDSFDLKNLLTISVDCLGTFPEEYFIWRLERKGSSQALTQESLQFARQGGIMAYRYRSACQFCISPDAHGAYISLGILGLPIRQYILVKTRDENTFERLRLTEITDGIADQKLVEQRNKILAKTNQRHQRTNERVIKGLNEVLPQDIDNLIDQFVACGDCQKCLDVCPICSIDYPQRDTDYKYYREDITRWIISCASCGMCEQACPNHKPLSAIFSNIQKQILDEFNYSPGYSIDEPLPII